MSTQALSLTHIPTLELAPCGDTLFIAVLTSVSALACLECFKAAAQIVAG